MTNKTLEQLRLPAEWEPCGGVLLAWPHEATDWNYMLPQVQDCYAELIRAVSRHAVAVVIAPDTRRLSGLFRDIDPERIIFCDVPTDDTWTRDYGVITLRDVEGNPVMKDFGFNAWGGKFPHDLDNQVNRRLHEAGLLIGRLDNNNDFILEGGSIESDGHGTILTTTSCLLTDTRNGTDRDIIGKELCERLNANHLLWLDHGALTGDDTDGHIDTIARLAPDNTILYCAATADGDADEQSPSLEAMLDTLKSFRTPEGDAYNLIELPLPDPIHDEEGNRLPATYANFLIVNDAILMPVYGQPRKDMLAEMTLKVAFPGHVIEKVDCRALICQHGSLHCATMQLPQDVLPI